MRARKTIEVETIRYHANHILAITRSTHATASDSQFARFAVAAFLETILHRTGNYHGFRYLTADEVPTGEDPGIARKADEGTTFPDDSRRYYH